MIKFIHTADWHLYDQHKYSVNNSKLLLMKRNLLMMIKYAVKHNVNVIFMAGDVFHLYSPNERLLKLLANIIKIAIKNGVAIRFITGNHDTDGVNYAFESLKTIDSLSSFDTEYPMLGFYPHKPNNEITIYTEDMKGTCFVFVPWQKHMSEALTEAKGFRSNNKLNVLITHCAVDGATTNSGFEMKRTKITKKLLLGWNYVALGDFHKYQEVMPNVYYSGSIVKTVWDERHDVRAFNVVTIDSDVVVKKVILPDDEFIEIEVKYENIPVYIKYLTDTIDGKQIKNSYIKVFVSGEIGIGEKLNLLKIHLLGCGANDVQIKIISNAVLTKDGIVGVSDDMNLNLDIKTACLMYMKHQHITDNNYQTYIEKKLTYEK